MFLAFVLKNPLRSNYQRRKAVGYRYYLYSYKKKQLGFSNILFLSLTRQGNAGEQPLTTEASFGGASLDVLLIGRFSLRAYHFFFSNF